MCFVHGYILRTQNHTDMHAGTQIYTLVNECPLAVALHTNRVMQESTGTAEWH